MTLKAKPWIFFILLVLITTADFYVGHRMKTGGLS